VPQGGATPSGDLGGGPAGDNLPPPVLPVPAVGYQQRPLGGYQQVPAPNVMLPQYGNVMMPQGGVNNNNNYDGQQPPVWQPPQWVQERPNWAERPSGIEWRIGEFIHILPDGFDPGNLPTGTTLENFPSYHIRTMPQRYPSQRQ